MASENKRVLIVAELTIQSSYEHETEEQAGEIPDTIQYWLTPQEAWRIRTFAADHDIHIYHLEADPSEAPASDMLSGDLKYFLDDIRQGYEDVIKRISVIRLNDFTDLKEIETKLDAQGLKANFELTPLNFGFYNPDGGRYRTKTQPKALQ